MEESTSPALPLCQCILARGGSEKDPPKGTHSHLTHRIAPLGAGGGMWLSTAGYAVPSAPAIAPAARRLRRGLGE